MNLYLTTHFKTQGERVELSERAELSQILPPAQSSEKHDTQREGKVEGKPNLQRRRHSLRA